MIRMALALSILAILGPDASAQPPEAQPGAGRYYVAPDGNDSWSGQLPAPNAEKTDGPLASLQGARDLLRKRKAAGAPYADADGRITVFVRGGTYELANTFTLEAADSGRPEAPVVYRAYPGDKPTLLGGRTITGFVPHQGAIVKTDVAAQGFQGVVFRQLFFDGQRQHLARFPNFDPKNPYTGGWAYADGKPVPMYAEVPGENHHSFQIRAEDLREWARPDEAEVLVFARYNWWNDLVRIASLDRASRLVTLAGRTSYPVRPGDRYFVRNLFEELDAPGEWYLDHKSNTLYFWPPGDVAKAAVYAPTLETILALNNASHIVIRGMTIECCEGTAVLVRDGTGCLIAGNTIRNVGGRCSSGIAAVTVEGGTHNGVVGNDIANVGSHAIRLSGGDRKTLAPAGNFADNNYIHHPGVFYKQGVGVCLSGVGNRASHNLIHDCPRFGILFSGNDQIIEYNHVRHVNLETADTGAIYSGGRDWLTPRGSVIRYNFFHDSLGFGMENGKWTSPHYSWGIYLDDNSAEVHVLGNIVARAYRGPIHFHCARDNLVENNIFIDGKLQQLEMNGWKDYSRHMDTMAPGYEQHAGLPAWQKYPGLQKGGHPKSAVPMGGNRFLRNILYYHDPDAQAYKHRSLRYEHFECDRNLVWHFGLPVWTGLDKTPATEQWSAWQKLGFDVHSQIADPKFVDPANDDYRLQPDSPAFALGFQPIPVDKIGPYDDPMRASWPIVEAPGVRETGHSQ